MATFNLSIALTFAIYLSVVLAIGVFAWLKTKTASDYFLGGRKLSAGVAAFSAGASDMSGWVLLGLPGYAYVAGVEAGWIALGLCIGVALNWLLSAQRLRIYSFHLDDAVTLPTYLHRRFCCPNPWLKLFAAVFILLFFLFYVSSGLIGAGKLFVAVFDFDYQRSVLLGASIIIFYTLFGGFLAVSWTDVFQALLMTLALVLVPAVTASTLGGSDAMLHEIDASNPALLSYATDREGHPLGGLAIASLLGWGLAYFGQPHILARFKAVHSHRQLRTAAAIGIGWSLLVYAASLAVGLSGVAIIDPPLADAEHVFMVLVQMLFHPVLAGFLLAAILAAIMSTVDSQLLVSSSALAEDLYPLASGRQLSDKGRMMAGRLAVAGIAVIAIAVAMDPESKVLDVVAYAWGGLGAALGPATLLSLYWRRMNWQGALAGVVTGGLTVIIWKPLSGGVFELYELVPAFFFSLVSIVIVSLLTPVPGNEVEDGFLFMKQELQKP
ncbi:MAG: sodium/proline symporter PutP [Gammaproteobacteria bacterium]|nr:MAG: sodium/proline symporter PutP [Gammaproteobacteria bacterium]